jgi:2-C-methyl-D-erythritol 2,4-cyclodiphosphate synthase
MAVKIGIGHDSHRFAGPGAGRPLVLGGLMIEGAPGLEGNSDADVVLHALCNAISGVSGRLVLGARTDALCAQGVTDSSVYVLEAVDTLGGYSVTHVSVSLEAKRPKLAPHVDAMRARIASILGLEPADVGVTATSGEGLTAVGRGDGIRAAVVVTAEKLED